MLRPSGTNLSGYCARSRDWRERASARAHERASSQDRREGGGDGGVRGRESAAASRVHAALCSGFSEALCLRESVKCPPLPTPRGKGDPPAPPRGRAAVREGGEQRAVPTSEDTSFQARPLRVLVLQTSPSRAPRATPGVSWATPRLHQGAHHAPSPSLSVFLFRGSAPAAQRREPRSVLCGPG